MNFEDNRIVILHHPPKISNTYGRYWSWMHHIILAHMGVMKPRSGSYTDPWNSKLDPLMKLPPLIHINDKLHDLMDARALELFHKAKATNRRIYIMWSGGIDSTGVLVSFLRNLSTEDQKILTVVYSEESIKENRRFWNTYINNKLDILNYFNFHIDLKFLQQGIVLTGDPGDAIFGPSSGMYADLIPSGKHRESFKDHTNHIAYSIEKRVIHLVKHHNVLGIGKWYAQKVTDNLLEVKPYGVESVADWWWWHYINLKWETSIWRPLVRRKTNLTEQFDSETIAEFAGNTFFNTVKFQQWSYSNLPYLIGNDVKNHKKEIKKYIFDFDHDEEYFINKTKFESLPGRVLASSGKTGKPAYWHWDWTGQHENPELVSEIVAKLEDYKG